MREENVERNGREIVAPAHSLFAVVRTAECPAVSRVLLRSLLPVLRFVIVSSPSSFRSGFSSLNVLHGCETQHGGG